MQGFDDKEGSMRARSVLAITASLILASAVLAQESGGTKAKNASTPGPGQPVVMPAADLKWTDLDPAGAPGVKVADLWGDHTKGAFGAFFKLPAGFAAPLHTHTHDMHVVFVSGTYIQGPEGKPEFRLGPGSYLMQPGGNYRHTTSCDKAAECLFLVESNGAFDLKLVEAGKAPGKNQ
jgi:anti-sigma factor ChrR (cupin superfamily)